MSIVKAVTSHYMVTVHARMASHVHCQSRAISHGIAPTDLCLNKHQLVFHEVCKDTHVMPLADDTVHVQIRHKEAHLQATCV